MKTFSIETLAKLAAVPRPTVDKWHARGLIEPVDSRGRFPLFDERAAFACCLGGTLLRAGVKGHALSSVVAEMARVMDAKRRAGIRRMKQPFYCACVGDRAWLVPYSKLPAELAKAEAEGVLLLDLRVCCEKFNGGIKQFQPDTRKPKRKRPRPRAAAR